MAPTTNSITHNVPPNTAATLSIGPIPTPTLGAVGYFSVATSTRIEASPRRCLDVLLATSEWPQWNRMYRRCVIDKQPGHADGDGNAKEEDDSVLRLGTEFSVDVFLEPDATARTSVVGEVITALEEFEAAGGRRGWRVAWMQPRGGGLAAFVSRSERVHEFVETEDGKGTDYTNWDTFFGPGSVAIPWLLGSTLERGFNAWMNGLKSQAEGKVAAQETPQPEGSS